MPETLPLTVLILSHRFDDALARAITSVAAAYEVLVFDYQREPNALQRFQTDWPNLKYQVIPQTGELTDFAQARNQALSFATQPWVLFLDSDEVVSSQSLTSLTAAVSQDQTAGYMVRRLDVFYGQQLKGGETAHIWLTRLAKRTSIHFERPVHEVAMIQGDTQKSQIEIWHYAHNSVSEFWESIVRYARIAAAHEFQQGKRFSMTELVTKPLAKAAYNAVWLQGYRDGWRGLIYIVMMSLHSLMVRVYLYELQQRSR